MSQQSTRSRSDLSGRSYGARASTADSSAVSQHKNRGNSRQDQHYHTSKQSSSPSGRLHPNLQLRKQQLRFQRQTNNVFAALAGGCEIGRTLQSQTNTTVGKFHMHLDSGPCCPPRQPSGRDPTRPRSEPRGGGNSTVEPDGPLVSFRPVL